jgi:hypothetical protein
LRLAVNQVIRGCRSICAATAAPSPFHPSQLHRRSTPDRRPRVHERLDAYRSRFAPGQVSATDWKIVATPDLNGDGLTDLYWHWTTDGALAGWRMDGAT